MSGDDKAKVFLIAVLVAVLIGAAVLIGYINGQNPEDLTGEIVDKERIQNTSFYADKNFVYLNHTVRYQVKMLNHADESSETFSTDASTYEKVRVGETGTFRVSGVKSLGRVLRAAE